MLETSPSVLIIRLDAIGDALALTPLLAALKRDRIPADVVLRPVNAGVFSSRAVRSVVTAGFALRSDASETLAAIAALGAELAQRRYTHVLVATEDPGGYRLARATGARTRVGFVNGWGKPFKTLWARHLLTRALNRTAGLDPRAPHECAVLFRLGDSLVRESEPTRKLARLRPLVIEEEPPADERVAVQITDKWRRLGFRDEDVAALVRRAAAAWPIRAIGSASESAYASAIGQATGTHVELFEKLEPWKRAIAGARAVIAPDSGALHVAGMTGTPVVGVFPQTPEAALQTTRWAPWAAPYRLVVSNAEWPAQAVAAASELVAQRDPTGIR
ncbi:MAG TPA: glycosyltransferase family 9 protein [Candidatus Acidoferrales bacterium]|nr:glycosyltransferase family 9 protein [Candidatus Acidoferrales bacterium]